MSGFLLAFRSFALHQWRAMWRSPLWQRSLLVNAFLVLLLLYFLLCFLVVGFFADLALHKLYPDRDPATVACRFLLYYFGLDLVVRFSFQRTPAIQARPYLHLPVPRSAIAHYLLLRSAPSAFTLLAGVLFTPFALRAVWPAHSPAAALAWLGALLALALANSYWAMYGKRLFAANPRWTLVLALALIGLYAADRYLVSFIPSVSERLFSPLFATPGLVAAFALLPVLAYALNYAWLRRHIALDESQADLPPAFRGSDRLAFLQRFGRVGAFIALEVHLIWRNRRPRSALWMSVVLLAYGLMFYPQKSTHENFWMAFLIAPLLTFSFALNYGQFMFSWESRYYDGLLSRPLDLFAYLLAKYVLLAGSCVAAFVLTLPYALFGAHILYINSALFAFNLGVNSLVLLFLATCNRRRLDLGRSSVLNWEGVGAAQFLLALPVMILPFLICLGFHLNGASHAGLVALALCGLLGLLSHRYWLRGLGARLHRRRYITAEGFRTR